MSRLKDLRTPVFWAEGHPGKLTCGFPAGLFTSKVSPTEIFF